VTRSRRHRWRDVALILVVVVPLALVVGRSCSGETRSARDVAEDVPSPPSDVLQRERVIVIESEPAAPDETSEAPATSEVIDSEESLIAATAQCSVRRDELPVAGCSFRFPGRTVLVSVIGEGAYELRFSSEAALPAEGSVVAPSGAIAPIRVVQDGDLIQVDLRVGAEVHGAILDEGGLGLDGAVVHLARRAVHTGLGGRCRMHGVPAGRYEQVLVERGGVVTPVACTLELTDGQVVGPVELTLATQDTLDVLVRLDGRPVLGARVNVCPADLRVHALASGVADEQGSVSLSGLAPGEYWVWASGPTIEPVFMERVRVPTTDAVVLDADHARTHSIRGRVVDPTGQPVEGASVSYADGVASTRDETDAEGRFELAGLRAMAPTSRVVAPEPFSPMVRVLKTGGGVRGVQIRAYRVEFDEEVELVLSPRAIWTGEVVVPEGQAVPAFDLLFTAADGGQYVGNFRDVDQSNRRRFTWRDAPLVPGVLQVRLADGRMLRRDVDPAGRTPYRVGVLEFPAGGMIALQLKADIELPRRVFAEWLDPNTGVAEGGAWLTRVGRAQFTSPPVVPPGQWRIVISGDGIFPLDVGTLIVAAERSTEVQGLARSRHDVAIVVRDHGEALGAVPVELQVSATELELRARTRTALSSGREVGGPGMRLTATTDEIGRAWFARVPAGDATVLVTRDGVTTAHDVRVGAGDVLMVDLDASDQ